jgi:hypothetical protein
VATESDHVLPLVMLNVVVNAILVLSLLKSAVCVARTRVRGRTHRGALGRQLVVVHHVFDKLCRALVLAVVLLLLFVRHNRRAVPAQAIGRTRPGVTGNRFSKFYLISVVLMVLHYECWLTTVLIGFRESLTASYSRDSYALV